MIKKISSIVILVCIILFNITPIVMAMTMPNFLVIHQQQAEAYQKKQNKQQINTPSIWCGNVSGDLVRVLRSRLF